MHAPVARRAPLRMPFLFLGWGHGAGVVGIAGGIPAVGWGIVRGIVGFAGVPWVGCYIPHNS